MGTIATWEYWVDTLGSAFRSVNDERLEAYLNQLGEEGWEVFSVEQLPNSVKIRVIARRLSNSPTQRKRNWPVP